MQIKSVSSPQIQRRQASQSNFKGQTFMRFAIPLKGGAPLKNLTEQYNKALSDITPDLIGAQARHGAWVEGIMLNRILAIDIPQHLEQQEKRIRKALNTLQNSYPGFITIELLDKPANSLEVECQKRSQKIRYREHQAWQPVIK